MIAPHFISFRRHLAKTDKQVRASYIHFEIVLIKDNQTTLSSTLHKKQTNQLDISCIDLVTDFPL